MAIVYEGYRNLRAITPIFQMWIGLTVKGIAQGYEQVNKVSHYFAYSFSNIITNKYVQNCVTYQA